MESWSRNSNRTSTIYELMAKVCQFSRSPFQKGLTKFSFSYSKEAKHRLNSKYETNAHKLKIVKLYSRTENYTAKRKMIFFFIAHSLLLAYFRDIFNFLPFLPEFFTRSSSYVPFLSHSLVPGACWTWINLNINFFYVFSLRCNFLLLFNLHDFT